MLAFYLALGFAMYTAILGIFELSLSISNQRFMNKAKLLNSQDITLQKNNDKVFLSLLKSIQEVNLDYDFGYEDITQQEDICLDINYSMNNEDGKYFSILNQSEYNIVYSYNPANYSYSSHPRLQNSCSLINDLHRIVINEDSNTDEYTYYSCIINIDPICRFELVD